MWGKGKNKKKDWEIEVERILKEGSFNGRLEAFLDRLDKEQVSDPPEEWQETLNTLFDNLLTELPPAACCILAFRAGQIWQKHQSELTGEE